MRAKKGPTVPLSYLLCFIAISFTYMCTPEVCKQRIQLIFQIVGTNYLLEAGVVELAVIWIVLTVQLSRAHGTFTPEISLQ